MKLAFEVPNQNITVQQIFGQITLLIKCASACVIEGISIHNMNFTSIIIEYNVDLCDCVEYHWQNHDIPHQRMASRLLIETYVRSNLIRPNWRHHCQVFLLMFTYYILVFAWRITNKPLWQSLYQNIRNFNAAAFLCKYLFIRNDFLNSNWQWAKPMRFSLIWKLFQWRVGRNVQFLLWKKQKIIQIRNVGTTEEEKSLRKYAII